jgi:hypothetical protein
MDGAAVATSRAQRAASCLVSGVGRNASMSCHLNALGQLQPDADVGPACSPSSRAAFIAPPKSLPWAPAAGAARLRPR